MERTTMHYTNEDGSSDVVLIPRRYRTGTCECCGRSVSNGDIKKTMIHHVLYDDSNPIRFTIELCYRCHSQYHRLSGEVGEIHRNKINSIVEKRWGSLSEGYPKKDSPRSSRSKGYKSGEHALTRKEYDKLLATCQRLEDRVLIMIAVSLGLRRYDIVRLQINNIDFSEHQLTYTEKKKGDRIRTVPLGPKLEQEIKILIKTIPKDQKTLFSFKDRQAYNRLRALCDRAGIPRRPFHALRATCVKFCQANGWTPEQVAELTGDTIAVIQEHYSTPSRAEMAEQMKEKEVI